MVVSLPAHIWLNSTSATSAIATDDPRMAEFMGALDAVNALAERSPGFVWRLKDDSNNATSILVSADPTFLVNMSVWETPEQLEHFVWNTVHKRIYQKKGNWFDADANAAFRHVVDRGRSHSDAAGSPGAARPSDRAWPERARLRLGEPADVERVMSSAAREPRRQGASRMSETPMPLWEVFIRNRSGLPHKHCGSVHAADATMALQAARDVYTRRGESVSLWVVPSSGHRRLRPGRQGRDVRADRHRRSIATRRSTKSPTTWGICSGQPGCLNSLLCVGVSWRRSGVTSSRARDDAATCADRLSGAGATVGSHWLKSVSKRWLLPLPFGRVWHELLIFGVLQAWACLFAGVLLGFILLTKLSYPAWMPIARYDFLLLVALAHAIRAPRAQVRAHRGSEGHPDLSCRRDRHGAVQDGEGLLDLSRRQRDPHRGRAAVFRLSLFRGRQLHRALLAAVRLSLLELSRRALDLAAGIADLRQLLHASLHRRCAHRDLRHGGEWSTVAR